ncbi:MAG: peptide chain release factor 3, partial [Gemmatimonadales bacterium]
IGDTLSNDGDLEFQGIPRFPPEHFARVIVKDPMRRKQLDTGLRQLTEEGAAQVFFTSGTDTTSPTPIVGAVGLLQFDVMLFRLETEYGVPCKFEPFSGRYPRWVSGPTEDVERVARGQGTTLLFDAKGNPLLLFQDAWALRYAQDKEKTITFMETAP